MWDIVDAILIAYSIIVGFEYFIKSKFSAPQPAVATISPETRMILEQKLLEQYEDVAAYGPKRKCIGFKA